MSAGVEKFEIHVPDAELDDLRLDAAILRVMEGSTTPEDRDTAQEAVDYLRDLVSELNLDCERPDVNKVMGGTGSSRVCAYQYYNRSIVGDDWDIGVKDGGEHSLVWNGQDARGARVSTGVYLYKVSSAGSEVVKKMALIK